MDQQQHDGNSVPEPQPTPAYQQPQAYTQPPAQSQPPQDGYYYGNAPGYAAPVYTVPATPQFDPDNLTGGEKAYVIILSVLCSIWIPITCWFCWRTIAPGKAKKALVMGLVTALIVIVLSCVATFAFSALIAASVGSAASALDPSYWDYL